MSTSPTNINIGIDLRPLATTYRTGVGEYTFEFLNALFKGDTTNQYYLFYHSRPRHLTAFLPRSPQSNVHLVPLRWPHKLLNVLIALTGAPKLDRLIEKQTGVRLDWLYSPNLHFTALSPNTRHVLMVHDLTFLFFKNYYTLRQRLWHRLVNPRRQCEQAFHIITPSENTKRDIVEYYKIAPEKITVLYPGLSSSFANNSQLQPTSLPRRQAGYNLPANTPYILFLGTIEPRKNILGLIAAFEIFNTQYPTPNIHLVIAGAPGWKNRNILARIKASPCKNSIQLIGYVKSEDKAALCRGAGVFVYPSFYEGFGFPVLEAMAAGVPVITSNRSSLPEVTGPAAYLANPHRPDEIVNGIVALLTNKALREEKIKSGLEKTTMFSWHKTVEKFQTILNSP